MNIQTLVQQFHALVPHGGAMSSAGGGLDALGELGDLSKALATSGYQSDVSQLTGGGSLTVQSLDSVMKRTIQENEDFVFFNMLASTNASNIVDEYVRQNAIGGIPGGSTNTELGTVRASSGDYSREIGNVKFLMSLRQVGMILNLGGNIVSAVSAEESNGALQLMTDANYLALNGHADSCPTQFDGFFSAMDKEIAAGNCSSDHVYNMDGAAFNDVSALSNLAAAIRSYGSWGRPTDILLTQAVQADLNNNLDPAFRWTPEGQNQLLIGGHVDGIRLNGGVVKTHQDTFLHDGQDFPTCKPWDVNYAAAATANAAFKPASVTVDASVSDSQSKFSTARAGNYYWAVAGIGPTGEGQSAMTLTGQTAVVAGKKATLTITASAGGTESGYAVYRSRQDGTNAAADLRLVGYVKKAGATTPFTDANLVIPGTSKIPLLDMRPASDAIGWRQYAPMTKIPLPFGVGLQLVESWFQILMGYLRITKPKRHGYIANVLPTSATWKPHG